MLTVQDFVPKTPKPEWTPLTAESLKKLTELLERAVLLRLTFWRAWSLTSEAEVETLLFWSGFSSSSFLWT